MPALTLHPPSISAACPDCGSSDTKPIVYGLPTKEAEREARLGHFVLGGCVLDYPQYFCPMCFNRWPRKPKGGTPTGRPEWIEERVAETHSEYAKLSGLADLPPDPEEPQVEGAWGRIDGSVEFLVSLGNKKARITKSLAFVRIGGAPDYQVPPFWYSVMEPNEAPSLGAVAALRFERNHKPETHNLHNEWDKVRSHWQELGWG
jgi:hypothetical protein